MTFVHGNKVLILCAASVFLALSIFLCIKIEEKKSELKMNMKKLELVQQNLEETNIKIREGNDI